MYLFTQQKATWEGILSTFSGTLWPYLEEGRYQDKHSWCCGMRTQDWKNKTTKRGKGDKPASSQPLVRSCWLELARVIYLKDTGQNPHHSHLPDIVVGNAGNPLLDGEMELLWGGGLCVQGLPHCPLSCSSAAITAPVCP